MDAHLTYRTSLARLASDGGQEEDPQEKASLSGTLWEGGGELTLGSKGESAELEMKSKT